MFSRIRMNTAVTNKEGSIVSQTNFGAVLQLHGCSKISREMNIGSKYTLDVSPNHIGLGFVFSSTAPMKVTLKSVSPLSTAILFESCSNVHICHKVLTTLERLDLTTMYKLEIENTSGEIAKFSCQYT